MIRLLLQLTQASKTGLVVRETNMGGGLMDAVNEEICTRDERGEVCGFTYDALHFVFENTSFIPCCYRYPSGKDQLSGSVSYRVTYCPPSLP